MAVFDMLAFDADDTLWHNERLYVTAQEQFTRMLSHYHKPEWVMARLYETETQNLAHFGYGIKAFALSMIETAVELTEGRISGRDIQALVETARQMINAEVELLEHVREIIPQLSTRYRLMMITKGDLLDQESKISRSGLGQYFRYVEIISSKTRESYEKVLNRYAIAPEHFLMVGNSLRSDILPILELGGSAVYIPYETTWEHELANPPTGHPGYHQLRHMGELPALLKDLENGTRRQTGAGLQD